MLGTASTPSRRIVCKGLLRSRLAMLSLLGVLILAGSWLTQSAGAAEPSGDQAGAETYTSMEVSEGVRPADAAPEGATTPGPKPEAAHEVVPPGPASEEAQAVVLAGSSTEGASESSLSPLPANAQSSA